MATNNDTEQMISIRKKQYEALKALAAKENRTLRGMIDELLRKYEAAHKGG